MAEQIERWRGHLDVRLYSMKAEPAAVQGLAVRRVASLPGPHLLRWTGWYLANTAMRRRDVRRARPPDLVYSPGINCPDADAMSVHIVFAKYWEEVGRETLARLVRPQQTVRALHRVTSWSLLRRLERKFYEGPPTLTALSQAKLVYLSAGTSDKWAQCR